MSYLLLNAPVVLVQLSAILCYPDSGDPLMKLSFCVNTQVADIFGGLHLNLGVFYSKAELSRCLVLLFPSFAKIDLGKNSK